MGVTAPIPVTTTLFFIFPYPFYIHIPPSTQITCPVIYSACSPARNRTRSAMFFGVGSLQAMEREHTKLEEKGPSRVAPLLVPLMISNMAAGNVSIAYNLKGKSINVVTACATGTNSIGEAFRTIQYGDADIMVAGGTESSITPIGIAGFSSLTALSTCEDPARCSIPFGPWHVRQTQV